MKKVLPILFLYFVNGLSFFILIPVLPFIVENFGGNKIWYTALIATFSAAQFIGSAWFGSLSDTYGRKKILIISQIGTLASWILFGASYFAPTHHQSLALVPLLIIGLSRIIDGITGGNNSVANAYLVDITSPKERTTYFGYIGAAFGLAMIIGPAIGGFSASFSVGYLGTALAAIIISTITLISLLFLKESLPTSQRNKTHNFSLKNHLLFFKQIQKESPNKTTVIIFIITALFSLSMSGYSSIMALYLIDHFKLNPTQLSFFFLGSGLFLAINQAFVVKILTNKFGENKTLTLGQISFLLGLIFFVFPTNIWIFIPFYYLINLGISLSFPTIKSILSHNTPNHKQGTISGLNESTMACMAIIAPIVSGLLYTEFGHITFWILAIPLIASIHTLQKSLLQQR